MAEKEDVDDKDVKDDIDPDDKNVKDDDDLDDDDPKSTKDSDKSDLGDAGKRAIDAMKRERNAALKELRDIKAKNKEYEDRDKTESQRLAEAAEDAKTRAGNAETNFRKLQTAMDKAPDGATLVQIKAVAKRLSGDTEEDMEADAEELFALLAPAKSSEDDGKKSRATKPRERLRGGGDPDDDPEEMDPRKLADLIGRP